MATSTGTRTTAAQQRSFAAVFVDFENVHHYLRQSYGDLRDLNEYVYDMLRNLQRQLERRHALQCSIVRAYGDFDQVEGRPQAALYRMGIETQHAAGTEYRRSADVKMGVEIMETLFTHPEIDTYVVMTGDQDYLPVIQQLRKHGRTAMTVAFRGHVSPDLMAYIGQQNYFDPLSLLDPAMSRRLDEAVRHHRDYDSYQRRETYDDYQPQESYDSNWEARREYVEPAAPAAPAPQRPVGTPGMEPITGENERVCLEVLLRNYGHHPEVWISPFLRKLSDALPRLADFERKALLNSLEYAGAIRIEKRRGEPYDYSIIVINHDHPSVRELTARNEDEHADEYEDEEGYTAVEEEEQSVVED